jgi:hemoglobin/transferrin/lactoferrin receptor protein
MSPFRLITLFLSLFGLGSAAGQTAVVKDEHTQQALEFVDISGADSRRLVSTDSKGRANLAGFENDDTITFSFIGYQPLSLSYAQLEARGFEVFLTEDRLSFDQVVVGAGRWERGRSDVPFSVAIVRAREVGLQNPQTAADLLGMSDKVFIQKSQLGGGSPMIRGFSTNRVLLVVDGVRMNNAIFRGGNLQNVISLDANAVQRAEIIFGPNSIMYGSDAIGGVMDFHTLRPEFSAGDNQLFGGAATLRYASASNEKTGHVHAHWGERRWAFLSSASFNDFGDLRMGSFGPDDYLRPEFAQRVDDEDRAIANPDPRVQTPSGYRQFNLMQKARFQPNDHWEFNYGFHYSGTSDVPRYDRLIERRGGAPRDAEWYYGPQRWLMNNLQMLNRQGNAWYDQARLIIAYQFFEESRHDRAFGRDLLRHRTETVDAFSANLDFDRHWGESFSLSYGAELVRNWIGSTAFQENIVSGETLPLSTRYPHRSTWTAYALYLSAKKQLHPKLAWLAGARYNQVSLHAPFDLTFFDFPFQEARSNNGALVGSTGMIYRPADKWQINLNLASGFRAPNIDDIGKVFDSAPGIVIVPNPGLRPEYAYNVELGAIKYLGSILRVDLSGFYTYLDNAIVRRPFQFNGLDSIVYDGELSRVQALRNAAKAWVYGVQAGLDAALPAGFDLRLSFNYQKGEEEEEDGRISTLRHAAPLFGAARLAYQRKRLRADFSLMYNGAIPFDRLALSERDKLPLYAKDADGNPHAPTWYTLNWKASYQLNSLLQFNLGVENITDRRYRPYSSGIAGPGRNLIVALRAGF